MGGEENEYFSKFLLLYPPVIREASQHQGQVICLKDIMILHPLPTYTGCSSSENLTYNRKRNYFVTSTFFILYGMSQNVCCRRPHQSHKLTTK